MNSKNDRESPGYRASDYVRAIVDSLSHQSTSSKHFTTAYQSNEARRLITHVVYLEGTWIDVDLDALQVSPGMCATDCL